MSSKSTLFSLVGRLSFALFATVALLALAGRPVQAASITVAKVNGVGVVAVLNDGKCSLIEAILNANDATNGRPYQDCAAGNPVGPDTINLPAMTLFSLTAAFDPLGPTGLPPITSAVTILGNGATIQRNANAPFFRLFDIQQSGNLNLEEVSLTGGYLPAGSGGAIRNLSGTLTVTRGELVGNTAPTGGGIYNDSGTIVLTQSDIADNTASSAGGGVYNYRGRLSIGNCNFTNNQVLNGGNGGAIWNVSNSQMVANLATFSLNGAFNGGALYDSDHSTATITRSTFDRNTAVDGGAIFNGGSSRLSIGLSTLNNNAATHDGGALYNDTATVAPDTEIFNSTLSYNSAGDGSGGAIYNNLGVISLVNATLTGNVASYGGGVYHNAANTSLIIRSIISGNHAFAGDEVFSNYENRIQSQFSLFGHSGATAGEAYWNFAPNQAASDINASSGSGLQPPLNDLNKILDPALKFNGGPTKNHALPFGSLAVDWAASADCLANPVNGIDQRDLSRNANGSQSEPTGDRECDIGAVERQIGERVVSIWWMSALKPAGINYNNVQMDFQSGDMMGYNEAADQWSVLFDASAAGISKNVTSFGLLADGSVLLGFGANQTVPGLGTVTPWDVVRFDPATGRWGGYLDGSTVGLTTAGEKIDAIAIAPDGRLVISTTGAATVPGAAGMNLTVADEDLLAFNPTAGTASGGTWTMFLDGSVIPGLAVEDVVGASIDAGTGDIYLLLQNGYTVGGVKGSNKEIILISRGPENTYTVEKAPWNGSAVGFNGVPDAIEIR